MKAHKCSDLARHLSQRSGSDTFCAATLREITQLIRTGQGSDVLLANETLDVERLRQVADLAGSRDARVTIAIDSPETLAAVVEARQSGPLEVLIDVNVGMPRCGVAPDCAGALADSARRAGLMVRGVMGYEGHVVGNASRAFRVAEVAASMDVLRRAHDDVGGEITSAGATGTFDLHDWVGEVQAGSFLLMDTSYGELDLPFRQSFSVVATVLSVNRDGGYAVGDAGLKAFGMDHGEPTILGHTIFFTSDEHVTFVPGDGASQSGVVPVSVGDRIEMIPGHIDPTMAMHERVHVIETRDEDGRVPFDAEVIDIWPIDMRNW